jgi:hypothetical protein
MRLKKNTAKSYFFTAEAQRRKEGAKDFWGCNAEKGLSCRQTARKGIGREVNAFFYKV